MRGSATSGVMVRGHSTQLEYSQLPDSVDYEDFMTCTPVWTPESPGACVQTDFLQVKVIFIVVFHQVVLFYYIL